MAKKMPYIIIAGSIDRPETRSIGTLEKGTGQSIINGEVAQILNARQNVGIPNYTEAWGVRLDKDGQIPEVPLPVRDPKYTGQIKEMKWGTPGGYIIECRYLKGYNTIDLQYQNLVLNAGEKFKEDTEAAGDVAYLNFQSGDNFYDPETQPYLVQMLRVHMWNESSTARNPESRTFFLREKDFEEESMKSEIQFDSKREALNIVADAASDNTNEQLLNLLNVVGSISPETPKEMNTYRYLQTLADAQPEPFLRTVKEYKRTLSDAFEYMKSEKKIDLSKEDTIVFWEDKDKSTFEGMKGKKGSQVQHVLENFLEPKVWTLSYQIIQIVNNLKK